MIKLFVLRGYPTHKKVGANLEACFIFKTENANTRSILIGVIYRSHESMDGFNTDYKLYFASSEQREYELVENRYTYENILKTM